MMSSTLAFCIVTSTALFIWAYLKSKHKLPSPPGPPALPLVGHLFTIPPSRQEYFFHELGKTYGDIVHLHIPTRSFIVLNSTQTATDLLEKRSHNYSDRPPFPIFELMGIDKALSTMRYGPRFQLHRKMMQQYFSRKDCVSYQPIQTRGARVLLQNLVSTPEKRDDHLSHYSTTLILRISFGHEITSNGDIFLDVLKDAGQILRSSGPPGSTAIDFFPFLQYFPSWFPGTHYAEVARRARSTVKRVDNFPLAQVQEQMANGTAKPSFMASNLEAFNNGSNIASNTIPDIQGAVGVIYAAGAETTWSSISIFFLAMVFNPECQARAQKEIDTVIGSGRLPGFEDRESLPYVECLVQETLRWNSPVPLGIPHYSLEDDVYNGMFIPKGSIVIANTRGMSLDDKVYSDPLAFNPSRYLPKPVGLGEPRPVAHYGFGRRICPGRYFADASIWIAAALVLATMDISMALDENGKEIIPELEFSTGITSHPVPFRCNIRPRNEAARSLIAQADISDNY
ncbi:cytochrome P450 [Collybia nuda]|uniref:Cytochrome P450 n=1 Tax=Collybia nuda TaxID=64659 RepID=A0A9P6CK42_9AGAR|nr:cytochrome P450 [Collybia nuda]